MTKSSSNALQSGMTTHRIEALTDGIFAIAMTLLVLTIDLPEMEKGVAQIGLHNLLIEQMHMLTSYAISFIVLAIFWIKHHQQFHFIKRTDGKHLWINIFTLMFIVLIPFSTSLRGDYPDDWVSAIFFGSNLLILGILSLLNWIYATNGHRLVDPNLDKQHIALNTRIGAVTPLVALLAMGVSIVSPQISSYTYLLIPILIQVVQRRSRRTKGD